MSCLSLYSRAYNSDVEILCKRTKLSVMESSSQILASIDQKGDNTGRLKERQRAMRALPFRRIRVSIRILNVRSCSRNIHCCGRCCSGRTKKDSFRFQPYIRKIVISMQSGDFVINKNRSGRVYETDGTVTLG